MSINPVLIPARQPRGIIRVNGEPMAGWVEWEVENNAFSHADTFHVVFAIGALPSGRDENWFASQATLRIEIFGGFPKDPNNPTTDEMPQWIAGFSDDIEIDYVAREIHLHGRDYTALLIDAQTQEKWRNATSSKIVAAVGAMFNLTTTYITPTTAKVGKYLESNTATITNGESYWDLLTRLATLEKMIIYVQGNDLHFEAPTDPNKDAYLLQWNASPFSFNGKRITVSRNITLAGNVQVFVRGYHPNIGLVQAIWPASVSLGAKIYKKKAKGFILPVDAMTLAKSIYSGIMQHEVKLTAELPADDVLTINQMIRVAGTAYDQLYYPDTITRRMSIHDGYTMSVTAKNVSPSNSGN